MLGGCYNSIPGILYNTPQNEWQKIYGTLIAVEPTCTKYAQMPQDPKLLLQTPRSSRSVWLLLRLDCSRIVFGDNSQKIYTIVELSYHSLEPYSSSSDTPTEASEVSLVVLKRRHHMPVRAGCTTLAGERQVGASVGDLLMISALSVLRARLSLSKHRASYPHPSSEAVLSLVK